MAKQTFTTGQVLTAAQMTSLQQTAMGGGSATAKTASYVLVAADAGTTVAMNAAGATTITVNTGLFAAGDTVFIQNLGAGACTITAGTATVATSGSLVLAQNQGGDLRFTSASAAIFLQFATPASGDIEGVTAGTGISGGGTSGTVTVSIDTAVTVDKTTAQTLTNKTLTSPIISTISNTGTLTLPTSTDTLVGRATTDTLTNKTLTSPALTTPTISTLTTNGDLLYGTGSGGLSRIGIGSTSQVLTVVGGIPAWATPAGGGGKVLQVVSATTTTPTTITTTTLTDSTITATITPTLNTSKILIIISANVFGSRDASNTRLIGKVLRASTTVLDYSNTGSGGLQGMFNVGGTSVELSTNGSFTLLDNPATTSATTYKLQGAVNEASQSASLTFQNNNNPSVITLLEIGA